MSQPPAQPAPSQRSTLSPRWLSAMAGLLVAASLAPALFVLFSRI